MRIKWVPIILPILVIALFSSMASCDGSEGSVNEQHDHTNRNTFADRGLSAQQQEIILGDWIEYSLGQRFWAENYGEHAKPWFETEYYYIDGFFGIYNDCIAVRIWSDDYMSLSVMWYKIIADIQFIAGTPSNQPLIWKGGNFYELIDAYEAGYLSREDVAQIHQLWHPEFGALLD